MSFTYKQLEVINFALQLLQDVLADDKEILTPSELGALEDILQVQTQIQSTLHGEAIGA